MELICYVTKKLLIYTLIVIKTENYETELLKNLSNYPIYGYLIKSANNSYVKK